VYVPSYNTTVPDPPATADLFSLTGDTLQLNWTAPLSDGGAAVQSYRVYRHHHHHIIIIIIIIIIIGDEIASAQIHNVHS